MATTAAFLAMTASAAASTWEVIGQEGPHEDDVELALESATADFDTSLGTVVCEDSEGAGTVADDGIGDGEPDGVLGSVEWSSGGSDCELDTILGTLNCSVTANGLGWDVEVEDPGELVIAEVSATVDCGTISCDYSAAALAGDVQDASEDVTFVDDELTLDAGASCPATADLNAVYEVTQTNGESIVVTQDQTPIFTANPTSWAFGNQAVNTPSTPKTITFTNRSNADIRATPVMTTNVVFDPATSQMGGCKTNNVVPKNGGTCTVIVTFTPTQAQAYSATVRVRANDPAPTNVPVTGTGV